MNLGQPFQRFPGRRFADGHVSILRERFFAARRIGHAHGQPCCHQRKQDRDLFFLQREHRLIARNNFCCSLQRIRFSENRVSGGDGGFRNRQPVVHVAKINYARHFARLRPGVAHQHVVVIRVAVNHAVAQSRQSRHNFRFIKFKELFGQRPSFSALNQRNIFPDPTGARGIPFQLTMGGGMLEGFERLVHLPQKAPKIAEKFRRVRAHFGQNGSLEEAQKPNKPLRTVMSCNFREKFAAAIWQHSRQRQLRCALRQMHQRFALQINERPLSRRVHHFQHKRAAVRSAQMKIVVVLARKRPRGHLQPVDFPGQTSGFGFRYAVCDARFQEHAPNFICNCRTASISPRGFRRENKDQFENFNMLLHYFLSPSVSLGKQTTYIYLDKL